MSPLNQTAISRSALLHNFDQIRRLADAKTLLAPCVKANAYGHGLELVAPVLDQAGADWFCVNSVEEGAQIRALGIARPILVLGHVPLDQLQQALQLNLQLLITNLQTVEALNGLATKQKPAVIHLKVDTGMSRQGVFTEDAPSLIQHIRTLVNIELKGLATHFATADEPDNPTHYNRQKKRFQRLVAELDQQGLRPPLIHAANSAATLLDPEMHFDLVRPGIACYGLWPSGETRTALEGKVTLQPTLTLKSTVAYTKDIAHGESVSYGASWTAEKPTRLAVLPIGYADGIDRHLSNRGEVLIGGKKAPIRGRVCMNILMVDITQHPQVAVGDEAVLIGRQGDQSLTAEDWADAIGTINYEVTTRLRENLPRVLGG